MAGRKSKNLRRVPRGGIKYDSGKPRYDLLPPEALESVVRVYTFGAKKYSPHNWRKGIAFSRLFSAAQRHLWAFQSRVDIDEESGLPHLAHAAFNVLALLQFSIEKRTYLDDRPVLTPRRRPK